MDKVAAQLGVCLLNSGTPEEDNLYVTASPRAYPQVFDWLELLDFNVFTILILMTVVAGFNMISGLLILLLRNISTIGTLKTMGMDNKAVGGVFVRVGAGVVLKGMLIGNALALLFCLIQGTTHLIPLDPANYFVSYVPVHVNLPWILAADVLAFLAILAMLWLPALYVSKNRWIGELSSESRFHQIQRDYQKGKPVHLTTISSYDPLVRKYAESIGWDWRLLSAIIFRESRFHPDANSHKGAIGLMQIRSSRYSTDTLLIPSVNLSVGTTYLKRLQNMFSSAAADTTECIKFTLAAYNAGEGRILQTIQTAREKGVDATRWDSVLKVIPDVPGFKGTQTIVYVEDVLNIYAFYTRFYPL